MNTQVLSRDKANLQQKNSTSNNSSCSSQKPEDDVEGKVKMRLMSMWNNMKYGWTVKLKTNFSKESPVWLLGKCYHKKYEHENSTELGTDVAFAQSQGQIANDDDEAEGIEGFKLDFVSRLWLTYRREFPILNGSNFSSDCGWGCMLRSGQMMLAQALVCHFLGRSWRWTPEQPILNREGFTKDALHRMIIKWFGDKPSLNSPLSIHTLVSLGESSGKQPGDWYGPAFVAHLLRQAVKLASRENKEFDNLNLYVAQDCAVYVQDIIDECAQPDETWKSLVIMIPVRLGVEKFNYIYGQCLTRLLSHENCIGIIGGRPKHSLYFVGYQDDKLIHLDPHYCQEMVDVWVPGFPLSSFHCRSPRKMHLSKMDPSCCFGFYCQTRADFFNFIKTVQPFLVPLSTQKNGGAEYPMFVFCDGRSSEAIPLPMNYPPMDVNYSHYGSGPDVDDLESEEFEIL